jgi:signal transduction histidine kinase
MTRSSHPLHVLGPVLLSSLLLLGLCTAGAVFLYRQQSGTADVLGENVTSRRAAATLEEDLADLIALHRGGNDQVEPQHERAERHLAVIEEYADKDEEKRQAAELTASWGRYLARWHEAADSPAGQHEAAHRDALRLLEGDTLPICRRLIVYNAGQIEESAQVHRQTLRLMAWGLAGVGGVGSLGGLLLGYGMARSLRRSLHRLRVHVQDAASMLAPDVLTVELNENVGLDGLQAQMQGLVRQIEQVVQQLHQREREVRRAEQLAAVGRLAAGVAHEIRNPLTSIKMLVQAGGEEGGAGLSPEDLAVIEREVRRLERSLNTFLDFARPPRPERTPQDLVALVEQSLGLIRGRAAKQHVTLNFDRPPGPVKAVADGAQLSQVLVNLLLNALDALPHGGRLDVELVPTGGAVELRVLDNGPGIAANVLPRLFAPFASGKETGLGLGLAVSRRIAEDHGGTLTGGNRPGGGAWFVLWLPVGGVRGEGSGVREDPSLALRALPSLTPGP